MVINPLFFFFHFGDGALVAIIPKKDLALVATSYWKTLENLPIFKKNPNLTLVALSKSG
jgi:hypothetical protein